MSAINSGNNNDNSDNSDNDQSPPIAYRRDRTPSIVVQSLGLSFHKDSNITESIELQGDEADGDPEDGDSSQQSTGSSDPNDNRSWASSGGPNEQQVDQAGGSAKGSLSSLANASSTSPVAKSAGQYQVNRPAPLHLQGAGNNRRLSLNIGSTAPRRQSLTVEGLSAASFVNPAYRDSAQLASGGGQLRNKAALKPGKSLMGWIRLASTAKDLSGTNGKLIEVSPEELAKHDKETDCWVALKGNVYNVTTYLQYHPGGVDELMRGAGRDATELFNEVHRWVNYESILAKCLVGPYNWAGAMSNRSATGSPVAGPRGGGSNQAAGRRDPTVAQKPPRRQSIALTVPSPNKYQSLLLSHNNSSTNLNQIQQPPTYVIMQDKSCIKLKIQDLTTLPLIRSRHLICDLNFEQVELHLSTILSSDWLYRVHLRLDQRVDDKLRADLSSDDGTMTIQLNKKEAAIWSKIGTSMELNDSLCEMTLADKFFRPCQLTNKTQLTHDTYLFEFKLGSTLMYVPIGWHILMREYLPPKAKTTTTDQQQDTKGDNKQKIGNNINNNSSCYYDYRVHKNYTIVCKDLLSSDGQTDESGFMDTLCFIIKIYPQGVFTSKLNQLKIGDSVDISDYQSVDFDIETLCMSIKHWILFAAGTGITPFCRTIAYLLSQSEDQVESVSLVFFNKTQRDIIWQSEFGKLGEKHDTRFKVVHVLSEEPEKTAWTGKRGRIKKELVAEMVDAHSPDELQILACGPRAFTQLTKSIATELNLQERLYVFHG